MTDRSIPPVVARYFECVNSDRLDELLELFHAEAEVTVPLSKTMRGRDEICRFYANVPKWFPQHMDTPVRVWQTGNSYAVEIEFHGTTADDKKVEFRAVDLIDFADGQILRLQAFYDGVSMLRQRGIRA